jgi:hypothetical protein
MANACKRITIEDLGEEKPWAVLRSFLAYHFTRRYPAWAMALPRHEPRLFPPTAPQPLAPALPAGARKANEHA